MVISQRQNLLNEIEEFVGNDYNALLAEKNADKGDISSLMAGDYKVTEIIEQSIHAIKLLQRALNSADWQFLPYTYSVSDYGQMNLGQVIQNMRNSFMSSSYANAVPILNFLLCYEKSLGIWSPARNIDLGIRESTLAKLEAKTDALQKHTEERSKRVESLISELDALKLQIDQFFTEKRDEATTLTNNTQSSNTLLAEIKGTQGNINTINETITGVNKQCSDILQKLNDLHDKANTLQSDLEKKNNEIEETRKAVDDAVTTESETVKKVYEEALESECKIKELMSYISDGTLAHSFNQRKRDVSKTSLIWLALGGVASFALVAIICYLFAASNVDHQNLWADIIMKSLKTFPVACMVVYFFKEYAKERSLTEEYAFREAVAITLKAYLDQLEGEKDENKRKLLLSTVEKLYTKPSFSTKDEPVVKFKTKDLVDIANKIVEGLKTIKK